MRSRRICKSRPRAWLSKPVRHSELRNALMVVVGAATAVPAPVTRESPSLGARVLIVEDNPVNQLVATGLLENLGCKSTVCAPILRPPRPLAPAACWGLDASPR